MNNEQIRASFGELAKRIIEMCETYLATTSTEPAARTALPARRFASVSGFVDADYVEFPEGEANGGGVLNGVPHKDLHYTRAEAEECVRNGVWREVPIEASASPVPRAEGGNTCDESAKFAAPSASASPAPGFVLVPVEPDQRMINAFIAEYERPGGSESGCYRAFLAASPAAAVAAPAPALVAGSQQSVVELLSKALEDIAQPANAGCGCDFPCRCNAPEAEAINAGAMRDIAHEALKAAAALAAAAPAVPVPAEQAWQPMETAPKDGREVLLQVAFRAGIPGKQLVGHFMEGGHCIEDHPAIARGWYFWNGCFFDEAAKPTHWMPLPAAPSLQQPKEGAAS